ncbi:hypothetical protein K402DRAFT_275703 [Aulographum hederae CBS 113979]|uniref:Uncharacterized protein n=1 Tax=Aulographum hederae CBS 113979 TaxID=1176131 RepID=A0A6G1GIL2_9PEZI|nr:hypothetical protein K402DRAFT_275703 [Aulographum hederae CBS 113979]
MDQARGSSEPQLTLPASRPHPQTTGEVRIAGYDIIVHLPEHLVLICIACSSCSVILPRNIQSHLRKSHPQVTRTICNQIAAAIDAIPSTELAQVAADIRFPVRTSPAIPHLPIKVNGFRCTVCPPTTTTIRAYKKDMVQHARETHNYQARKGRLARGAQANPPPWVEGVRYQQFLKAAAVGGQRLLFEVEANLAGVASAGETVPVITEGNIRESTAGAFGDRRGDNEEENEIVARLDGLSIEAPELQPSDSSRAITNSVVAKRITRSTTICLEASPTSHQTSTPVENESEYESENDNGNCDGAEDQHGPAGDGPVGDGLTGDGLAEDGLAEDGLEMALMGQITQRILTTSTPKPGRFQPLQ